jgi:hypothetical protein
VIRASGLTSRDHGMEALVLACGSKQGKHDTQPTRLAQQIPLARP